MMAPQKNSRSRRETPARSLYFPARIFMLSGEILTLLGEIFTFSGERDESMRTATQRDESMRDSSVCLRVRFRVSF